MTVEEPAPSTFVYEMRADFGPYLRAARESLGLSIRDAATRAGVSATWMQKLETTGRVRKPTRQLLHTLATVYGLAPAAVEAAAGVRQEPVSDPDVDVHARFASLMLHEELRPPGMTPEWLDSFSVRQKRQILAWIEALLRRGGLPEALAFAQGSSA